MSILDRNVPFTLKSILFLMAICFWLATTLSAHANRDIVFSARFYAPPGHHILTHFHFYRINPLRLDSCGCWGVIGDDFKEHVARNPKNVSE